MRTIGKHWPKLAPRGDFQAMCDYCGAMYRRSQLRRDASGRLVCSWDEGRDEVTLDRENARILRRVAKPRPKEAANFDGSRPSADEISANEAFWEKMR